MTIRRILQSVLVLGVAALLALLVWFILSSESDDAAADPNTGDPQVVREDSHVINQAPDEKAVLVEFLDFECEVCRAYYPTVEQLREQNSDELTLVIRYFPIPSHANANNSAIAVEAAARQGQLEAMYQQMYATQAEWGEARESKAEVFRGFAQDLGLDMAQYDADVADPEVAARVQRDFDEGTRLGVRGTPTFFLDGQQVAVQTPEDLTRAVQEALDQ